MKIEEFADQIEANGECLRSFAKVMRIAETRDAEQLAAALTAFLGNEDLGNTSFAEIALPVLTECVAWEDRKEAGSLSAQRLGDTLVWFIRTARLNHTRERDRDADYKFVNDLLGTIKDRDNLSCKAAAMKYLCVDAPTIHTGPGLELEHTYESFRCLEFRGHKLDPKHHYQEEELLHMDGDGDEIVSDKAIRIGDGATVAIQVLDDATPADALRILRKMIAAIEKTGLPRGAWTNYTDHPATGSIDAHIAALREREEAEPALANLSESPDAAEYGDLTTLVDRLERLKREDKEPSCQLLVMEDGEVYDNEAKLTEPEFLAAVEAIKEARASAKAEGAPPAESAPADEPPNPEAEALVDEIVATFDKLRGVVARQKEAQPQE